VIAVDKNKNAKTSKNAKDMKDIKNKNNTNGQGMENNSMENDCKTNNAKNMK
jgi:hypothetical protein